MILSFINIRKVSKEVLKTEGEHSQGPKGGVEKMLMNGKSCLIPITLQPF